MAGFEQLDRIVTLKVKYTTIGNVSINTGRGDGIRDNLVIREAGAGSNPVISGSGVKGVVRSTIEAMLTRASESATDAGEKERLKVCIPPTCRGTRYVLDSQGNIVKDRNGKLKTEPYDPPNRLVYTDTCEIDVITPNEKPCLVCQMFGNTKQKGKVIFHDAKADRRIATMSRTHVAIARDSEIASGGALMTLETVPSGEVFNGSVVLVNPDEWMVGAVYEVLGKLIPKLGVGAKTTNGYGELKVEITPELTLRPVSETETLQNYIDSCLTKWHTLTQVSIT